jgi:hypothetical protein
MSHQSKLDVLPTSRALPGSRARFFCGALTFATVFAAAACSSDNGLAPGGGNTRPDTVTVSAQLVDSVANAFYAHVIAGDDLVAPVSGILGGLFPVATTEAQLDSVVQQGVAMVTEQQISDVAAEFQAGTTFDVANFASAAASAGATVRATGAPLDVAALTNALAPLDTQSRYQIRELVPAFVLALGRARVAQTGVTATDAVWGDGKLDPLQLELMLYAVNFAGGEGTTPVRSALQSSAMRPFRTAAEEEGALPEWLTEKLQDYAKDFATEKLGELIKFPLDWKSASKASICASVILYSYKFRLFTGEHDLWHRDLANPNHLFRSTITATLVFDFKPYNAFSSFVLSKLGCKIPPAGAAPGKEVQWSLDDTLSHHGSFRDIQTVTDQNGNAQATYQTINEVVPRALQAGLAKNVTGTYNVRAVHLIDEWGTLEKSVGVGVYNPTDTGSRINVSFWKPPVQLYVSAHISLTKNGSPTGAIPDSWTGVGDITVTATQTSPDEPLYQGIGDATYESFTYEWLPNSSCVTVEKTQDGKMIGLVVPDTATAGNVTALFGMTSPIPAEIYTRGSDCGGRTETTPNLFGTFADLHLGNLNDFKLISQGHVQKVIDGSETDGISNFTEKTTIDIIADPGPVSARARMQK